MEPGDEGFTHGGSFKKYMRHKMEKLDRQHDQEAEQIAKESAGPSVNTSLFKGLSVHVNGCPDEGFENLRSMILARGGKFKNYYRCDNLARSSPQNSSLAGVVVCDFFLGVATVEQKLRMLFARSCLTRSSCSCARLMATNRPSSRPIGFWIAYLPIGSWPLTSIPS